MRSMQSRVSVPAPAFARAINPMKSSTLAAYLALAGLVLAGCATTPPRPRIVYPITYNIQVGNTQVTSGYGGQNLNIHATQQVAVAPGVPLYYQLASPIPVAVTVSEITTSGVRAPLGDMRGTSFTTSIVPSTGALEFAFTPLQPNTNGTLQFTLSDRPIAPATMP